jgi:hypothetical protein
MISAPTRKKGNQPGKSGITPCKHFLLNRLMGREMGVLSRGMPPVKEVLLYDLTAGDGVPYIPVDQAELLPQYAFGEGCSPGIFLRHTNWLAQQGRLPVRLTGCEKQATTHAELVKNTSQWLVANDWTELSRGVHAKGYGEVRYLHVNSQELQPPLRKLARLQKFTSK